MFYKNKNTSVSILREILNEEISASKKYPMFHSYHEAYGVIAEEFAEFFDEVRKREPDKENSRKELIQIAAMCIKAIKSLEL